MRVPKSLSNRAMSTSYHSICPERAYVGLLLDMEQSDPERIRELQERAGSVRVSINSGIPVTVQVLRRTYPKPNVGELPVEVNITARTLGYNFNLGRYRTEEVGRWAFAKAVKELDNGYRIKLKKDGVELVPPKGGDVTLEIPPMPRDEITSMDDL